VPLPAKDPLQTGTMVFMEHLRVSVFGQVNEQRTDGDISPLDVEKESYSFSAAFGTSRRLERVIETPAAQEKRELQDAAIEKARRGNDILAAYEKSKKINQMRKRLKAFQMSPKRPDETKNESFDIDSDHASRSDVSECLSKWLQQQPSYCIEIDSEIGVGTFAQTKKNDSIEKQILRCPLTLSRDAKACDELHTRGLLNDDSYGHASDVAGFKTSQAKSEIFLSWLEDASKHASVTCGGGKGCVLSADFDGLEEATQELVSVLLTLRNPSGDNGKKKQMSEFYDRQDDGAIKFLEFRKRQSLKSPKKGDSFWSGAVPPAGAGRQCFDRALEYSNNKSEKGTSCTTNTRKPGHAKKSKRVAVTGEPGTWTSSFLRKFLREKGKRSTGSRSELEAWAKDLEAAPKARARSTKSPLLNYTVQRLKTELSARSLSTAGRKEELIERLEKADQEISTEAALLRSSALPIRSE